MSKKTDAIKREYITEQTQNNCGEYRYPVQDESKLIGYAMLISELESLRRVSFGFNTRRHNACDKRSNESWKHPRRAHRNGRNNLSA